MSWLRHSRKGVCLLTRLGCLGLGVVSFSLASASRITAADCSSAPAGLAAWWTADGNTTDIAGGNNGTLQGGATANATGKVGLAFSFDGTNGYVQVPDAPALKPTNLTIEAWVQFSSLNSAGNTADPGQQYIVFKQNSRSGNFEGYDLGKSRITGADTFSFRASSSSGIIAEVFSQTVVVPGVWYHVAGIRGPNVLQLYVNGQLEAQAAANNPQDYGSLPLYFGTSGQSYWDRKFEGTLDEVSIYSRALSSNEVSAIYAAGAAGKCKGAAIAIQPQSQTVVAGTNVLLSVTATGYGALSYQWRYNGVGIPGASNSGLTLTNVQTANAGSYVVVVTNSLASATSASAVLTVLVSPSITLQPASRTNQFGSTSIFTVTAGGTLPLSYQWYFNRTNALSSGGKVSGAQSGTLVISNVVGADGGSYAVVVANAAGSETSAPPAVLKVNDPIITSQPVGQTNAAGTTAIFRVQASGTAPAYQWFKNATPIIGLTNASLTLSNLSGGDAGSYSVIVSNVFGSVVSSGATLVVVYYVPKVKDDSYSAAAGTTLTVAAPGVLGNDTGSGTLTAVLVSGPVHGTLNLNPNGGFAYVPLTNYVGTDSFAYQTVNGSGTSSVATVTISLTADGVLFYDQFARVADPGPLSPWIAQSGNWTVTGGALVGGTNAGQSYGNAYITNSWTDYSVEGRIQFLSPNAYGGGIGGRLDPATGAHYAAWVYPEVSADGYILLRLIKFQTWTNFGYNGLNHVEMAMARVPATGANAHAVKLAFQGIQIKVFYEGEQVMSVQDTEAHPLLRGGISADMWTAFVPDTMALSEAIVRPLILEIPDPQLEAALRSSLSDYTSANSNLDLPRLTCLWACDRQITNLNGLQWATNLVSLYLNNNGISDLTPLAALASLRALELYGDPTTDLTPIAGLTNLSCLVLGAQPVTDYSPLSGLTNLAFLSIRQGTMASLASLKSLTGLTTLKLWETGIKDISALAKLTNLTCLDLRWNSITNFAPALGGLTNLTSLYLGGNCISTMPPLQNLKQLTLLNLDDNRITNLSPVTNLTKLAYLAASRNTNANLCVLSNLTGLVSLELRGNSVSNLNFLSTLRQLSYADLAYNRISDLRPLTNLTGLTSLVLAGNPVANYLQLGQMRNLTNLWLFDNAISNASFVANLSQLNHLNLDQNKITDIGPLISLTNLTGLRLDRNEISGYSVLTNCTSLTSLGLDGNRITTNDLATFLPKLTQLRFLSLAHNQIASLFPILGLTNLEELYLRRNRLSDIGISTNLPNLQDVDLSLNLLDLTPGSPPMSGIRNLRDRRIGGAKCACGSNTNSTLESPCQGINIAYEPQNKPPEFARLVDHERRLIYSPMPKWFIAANTNSTLSVSVWEDPPPEDKELVVTVLSSNSNLVSTVTNLLTGTNYSRAVEVVGGNPSQQTAVLTLTVSDDVLLAGSTNILVTVVANTKLSDVCPNVDPNLAAAISGSTGKPVGDLGIVDLLMLSELQVQNLSGGEMCVWKWLTNITTFAASGNATTNLGFVTNLPQVTSFTLNGVGAGDWSALANLTNLLSLSLYNGSISNLNCLTNLTQLTSLVINNVSVTDLSPLKGLSNLVWLSLGGQSISNLDSLTQMTRLASLNLYKTRVVDLTPLAGLTNLQYLSAAQNRLTNIVALTNLPQLRLADLSLNLLDISAGGSTLAAIQALGAQGATVYYLPQRQPPAFDINSDWVIAANTPSWLSFLVSDNASASDLSVTTGTSNTNLLATVDVGESLEPFSIDWFLTVRPGSNQVGATSITLTATNDAGLGTTAVIAIVVEQPLPLSGVVFTDTNLLSWATSTNTSWFGQRTISHLGALAAQSGSIMNSDDSWITAIVSGPGTLSFWWKVSSETNFDFLRFYVGTNEQARISGETDWHQQTYNFPPGTYTLMWDYSKDFDTSHGMDAGWVAQVSFVPVSWLQVGGSPGSGQVQLTIYGQTGKSYQVMHSPNLADWFPLSIVTVTNGVATFVDLGAGPGARYYRLQ